MEHAWEAAFESSEALRNDIISEAEALYRQTGLTPAQLQARVAELEGALRDLYCAALDDVLKNDSKIDRPSVNRAGNVLDGVASA